MTTVSLRPEGRSWVPLFAGTPAVDHLSMVASGPGGSTEVIPFNVIHP